VRHAGASQVRESLSHEFKQTLLTRSRSCVSVLEGGAGVGGVGWGGEGLKLDVA